MQVVYHTQTDRDPVLCDFGEGLAKTVPIYKWKGCKSIDECAFIRDDSLDYAMPRLYNETMLADAGTYVYSEDTPAPNGNRWLGNYYVSGCVRPRQVILTDMGIMETSSIVRWLSAYSYKIGPSRSIATDWHTGQLSVIAPMRNNMVVFTDRGGHVETTTYIYRSPYDRPISDIRAHNIIGSSIYIVDDSIWHHDTRIGDNLTKLLDNAYGEVPCLRRMIPTATRAMGECIIGIAYMCNQYGEADYRGIARLDGSTVHACLFDTRWPLQYAAEYPHMSVGSNCHDICDMVLCPP